jgi:hypothetical protein
MGGAYSDRQHNLAFVHRDSGREAGPEHCPKARRTLDRKTASLGRNRSAKPRRDGPKPGRLEGELPELPAAAQFCPIDPIHIMREALTRHAATVSS